MGTREQINKTLRGTENKDKIGEQGIHVEIFFYFCELGVQTIYFRQTREQ